MSKETDDKPAESSESIQEEHVKKSISRCYNMIDHISDSAAGIISDIIYNSSCSNAKQLLVFKPEELAIKAFKKVLGDFESMGYRSKDLH